jgi:hypothetical protein
MKKSYEFVPAPTVTACKEIARALIKHSFAFYLPPYEVLFSYSERSARIYADSIEDYLSCHDEAFRRDFEEWIKRKIRKIYRQERSNHHES